MNGTADFMGENFLLPDETSRRLYFECAEKLPVIDYHCHINPADICINRRFADLAEVWLSADHYKWRLMRAAGIDEEYITGKASGWEKFRAFAKTLPQAAGNPVYHWTHLELRRYFDCNLALSPDTAREIWEHCRARMPSVREIIKQSNVEIIVTTDKPQDDLLYHRMLRGDSGFTTRVLPSFRVDAAPDYNAAERAAFFAENGCVSADIGTEDFSVIRDLAPVIKSNDWVMQLRFGALRNVNTIARRNTGADSGFDTIGSGVDAASLARLLDELHGGGILRTLLFSLNPNDNEALCALAGCFPEVFQGPAWWFNDSYDGILSQLKAFASTGLLGRFPGMLTDSRSFLSYTRHEYFRRILCGFLGGLVERGEYPRDFAALFSLVRGICYENALEFFRFNRNQHAGSETKI